MDYVIRVACLSDSVSRFACEASAVNFQGLSFDLFALCPQPGVPDSRDWQVRRHLIWMCHHPFMQPSSVGTSTLTPLVAVGRWRLDKMFPFTVGANVGTTVTVILSALAPSNMKDGMTVALAHLFFNLFGALIWFLLPFLGTVPISASKFLVNTAG